MRRAAIYARVSTTNGQTTENQVRELRQVAERAGWEVVGVYDEAGVSGSKRREERPQLDAILKAVTRREVNMVMAWSVDRLGRSLQDLLSTLQEVHAAGADLYLHQQAVDTTTPAGKALFSMMGVFAEFERAMIRERVNAGLARAKAEGKKLGRPRRLETLRPQVLALRAEGVSLRKIAARLECSLSMVQRALGQGKAQAGTEPESPEPGHVGPVGITTTTKGRGKKRG